MQLDILDLVFLIIGAALGSAVLWVIFKGRLALAEAIGHAAGDVERAQLAEQLRAAIQEVTQSKVRASDAETAVKELRGDLMAANGERAQLKERAARISELEGSLKEAQTKVEELNQLIANLREQDGRLTQELQSERTQSQEKLALLDQAKQALSDQFRLLAGDILDEKSKKFTEQNQANLNQLLTPLKQQLTDFKAKVEDVYVNEGKDRSALTEQVKQLMALNQTLSQDANNLALAIKGDRKAQGNWGEIILDDVLEKAGLLRGQHYERQSSVKSEDGQTHVIPDVVIKLPGDRHLVVDSKFTLPDYRAFTSAENDEYRTAALKRHLVAIRSHIKGLSEKNYQSLYGLKSLDFVVMFIPLEPAFMLAVTNDSELFQQAWEKNVLLVSPSTLLFVVRTVAYLWRQEGLSRNAKEISNRGAELYQRLCGFVEELNKVGTAIEAARGSFDEAKKKLSIGKGNVIRQAEMLKELGVKPSKALPAAWVEPAMDEHIATLSDESDRDTAPLD